MKDKKVKENKEVKSKDEKIEEIKRQKCVLPFCDCEQAMMISLPLMIQTEDGQIKHQGDEESHISIPVPVCKKHLNVFMRGMFAILESKQGHHLIGPVEIVQVVDTMLDGFRMELKMEQDKNK